MDPLSITAGVIAVLGTANATYKVIKDFMDAIVHAPKEVQDIYTDAGDIYNIISNLQEALRERRIGEVVRTDHLAQKHIQDLQEPLSRTSNTLDAIVGKLQEHFRPVSDAKQYKLRWLYWRAREDFQELLARLRRNKEALSLSMNGLHTFQALRTLGQVDGNAASPNSDLPQPDPASCLRSYAESVVDRSASASPPTANASLTSRDPISSASVNMVDARRLARQRRQQQLDLLNAARMGDDLEVEILLSEGVEVDFFDPTEGKTALHLAAQYGRTRVAQLLLEHGADLDSRCEPYGDVAMVQQRSGRAPLHWAAAGDDTGNRQESIVRLLLDHGANVNARTTTLRTPLQEAVMYTRTGNDGSAVVLLLLERGAMVNAVDLHAWTPLHEAAFYGNFTIARILLRHGAEISGQPPETDPAYKSNPNPPLHSPQNRQPIVLTTRTWSELTIRLLLEHGANINARNVDGLTLLQLAARLGKLQVVLTLIEFCADLNLKTADGDTPLHIAAYARHVEILRALVGAGADFNVPNYAGQVIDTESLRLCMPART